MKGTPVKWTDKMIRSLRRRYHTTPKKTLAKQLGVSLSTIDRKRRELEAAANKIGPSSDILPTVSNKTGALCDNSSDSRIVGPVTGSIATTNVAETAPPPMELVAMRPEEMHAAQTSLKQWFRSKLELVQHEAHDASRNLEIAKQSQFKADSFVRASRMADRRVMFYEKLLAAVEAGFVIVPDFPVDVIAIRVTRDDPRFRTMTSPWKTSVLGDERAELAPVGEGRYVNPQPAQRTRQKEVCELSDGRKVQEFQHTIAGYVDVEFPVAIAQPAVMDATRAAMLLNIFDEIGCLPARRKPDPIVVGRIYDPRDQTRRNPVCFLIAWWVDTRTL